MPYTPYTPQFANIQRPVYELPVELIATAAQRKQQTYDTNLDLTTKAEGMLNQIPTVASDTPMFQEHVNNFKTDLTKLNESYGGDYSNPEYSQKANLLISKYATAPELKGWVSRYNNQLADHKKYQEDPHGLIDYNPGAYDKPLYSIDDKGNKIMTGQMSGNLVKNIQPEFYKTINDGLSKLKASDIGRSLGLDKLGDHDIMAWSKTKGIRNDDIIKATNGIYQEAVNSPAGQQFLYIAKRNLLARGIKPTEDALKDEVIKTIYNQGQKYTYTEKDYGFSGLSNKSDGDGSGDKKFKKGEGDVPFYLNYGSTDTGAKAFIKSLEDIRDNNFSNPQGINSKTPNVKVINGVVTVSSLDGRHGSTIDNTYIDTKTLSSVDRDKLKLAFIKAASLTDDASIKNYANNNDWNKKPPYLTMDVMNKVIDLSSKFADSVNASMSYVKPGYWNEPKAALADNILVFGPTWKEGKVNIDNLKDQLSKYTILDPTTHEPITIKKLDLEGKAYTDKGVPVSLDGILEPESLTKETYKAHPNFSNGVLVTVGKQKVLLANTNMSGLNTDQQSNLGIGAIASVVNGNTNGETGYINPYNTTIKTTINGKQVSTPAKIAITPQGNTTNVNLDGKSYNIKDNTVLVYTIGGQPVLGAYDDPYIQQLMTLPVTEKHPAPKYLPQAQAINTLLGYYDKATYYGAPIEQLITIK